MATRPASSARAAVDLTFEELYRGYRADVYRAALRALGNAHDAEDATQAAFADAYRAVLRGTRPQSPRAWLLAISENVRRRGFRTAQRRPREDLVDDADFPAAELPDEQSRALAEALAALPDEQRRVFVLREIVGLSYAEIAEAADSTVASIQMLLFRARRSLREQLDPPTVAVRRPIFLPPVPSWLAGLASRVELASLTPRAAGALGATVLAVAGASVAVPVPQAVARDAARSAAAATARESAAAPSAAAPVARKATPIASPQTPGGAAPTQRPARRSPPVTPSVPPSAPAAPAAAPAPAPTSGPATTSVVLVDTVVQTPLELPLSPASLPALTAPLPVQVPSLSPVVPAVVDAATGAAGAAGASAPPVPVSLPPLPALPQAP
jgi:RNA polymerase sigma-70 factor (ECF subfamily)